MSNTAEPVAVRVPREFFEDALRQGLALSRETGVTPDGKPYSSYPIAEATRCSMSILIDRLRSEGWTIEPPRPKAIRKPPPLKGGIG